MQLRLTDSNFRVPLQQHRHRTGALGGLAGTSAGVLGDVRTDDDGATILVLQRQVAQRMLDGVDRTEARVLDFGYFAVAVDGGQSAGPEAIVQHALDDDGAGGIVRAGFGAQAEKPDPLRVDSVTLDQAHGGRAGHGIDTLMWAAHPKAVADHRAGLVPGRPGPLAPVLQTDSIGWHIGRKSADPDVSVHFEFLIWLTSRVASM